VCVKCSSLSVCGRGGVTAFSLGHTSIRIRIPHDTTHTLSSGPRTYRTHPPQVQTRAEQQATRDRGTRNEYHRARGGMRVCVGTRVHMHMHAYVYASRVYLLATYVCTHRKECACKFCNISALIVCIFIHSSLCNTHTHTHTQTHSASALSSTH
jgi:hypothetical protein